MVNLRRSNYLMRLIIYIHFFNCTTCIIDRIFYLILFYLSAYVRFYYYFLFNLWIYITYLFAKLYLSAYYSKSETCPTQRCQLCYSKITYFFPNFAIKCFLNQIKQYKFNHNTKQLFLIQMFLSIFVSFLFIL